MGFVVTFPKINSRSMTRQPGANLQAYTGLSTSQQAFESHIAPPCFQGLFTIASLEFYINNSFHCSRVPEDILDGDSIYML